MQPYCCTAAINITIGYNLCNADNVNSALFLSFQETGENSNLNLISLIDWFYVIKFNGRRPKAFK